MRLWTRAKASQRAADLGAGGVAVGVQDAGQGVSAFAGAQEGLAARAEFVRSATVEIRAPLDQFGHAQRPFAHQRLGGGAVDEAVAGIHGVFKVQGNVFVALHGHGDAALRVVGVRFAERLLGDDQNLAVAGQLNCRAQPGHARAHTRKSTWEPFAINPLA